MVVAQLVERLLPIPKVRGANPVNGINLYIENLFIYCHLCWKDKNKEKVAGYGPIFLKERERDFVDVEGTKDVKQLINLLAITVNLYHEIDADPSGSGSKTDRVRKQQMLIKYT